MSLGSSYMYDIYIKQTFEAVTGDIILAIRKYAVSNID